MTLLFLTVFACVIVFLLVRRDRTYLKKETRDIVSEEMKKRLNIPTKDDQFFERLKKDEKAKKASEKLMREMNQEK